MGAFGSDVNISFNLFSEMFNIRNDRVSRKIINSMSLLNVPRKSKKTKLNYYSKFILSSTSSFFPHTFFIFFCDSLSLTKAIKNRIETKCYAENIHEKKKKWEKLRIKTNEKKSSLVNERRTTTETNENSDSTTTMIIYASTRGKILH